MLIVAIIAIKAPALRRAKRTLPKCPVRFRSVRERIIAPDA
jgi:hypothetical protein